VTTAPSPSPPPAASPARRQRALLWGIGAGWALLQAAAALHRANPDAVSYLDLSDRALAGDWAGVVNPHWSPLYPLLLALGRALVGEGRGRELAAAHLVNLVLFLAALWAFDRLSGKLQARSQGALPGGIAAALGSMLFLWTSLQWLGLAGVSPDLGVLFFALAAASLALGIGDGEGTWRRGVGLGALLAAGYAMKAILLPFGVVLFLALAAGGRRRRRRLAAVGAGLATLVLLAAPLIWAVSRQAGRFTISDSGRLNYGWFIGGLPRFAHWQGEEGCCGRPLHPTRRLAEPVPVFEFRAPVGGTYPPWYDPSYWYRGYRPRFDAGAHLSRLGATGREVLGILLGARSPGGWWVAALLVLVVAARPRGAAPAGVGPVMVASAAVLGAYLPLVVSARYLPPFVVLLLLPLLLNLKPPASWLAARWFRGALAALAAVWLVGAAWAMAADAVGWVEERRQGGTLDEQVAAGLRRAGVEPGSDLAFVGPAIDQYWPRLLTSRLVAEVREQDRAAFWDLDAGARERVMATLEGLGVAAVVTDQAPPQARLEGWEPLGTGGYRVWFPGRGAVSGRR
jgi:hypothetical protein